MTDNRCHNCTCLECGRVFDLDLEDDADEFCNGHDCEAPDCEAPDCEAPVTVSATFTLTIEGSVELDNTDSTSVDQFVELVRAALANTDAKLYGADFANFNTGNVFDGNGNTVGEWKLATS